MALFKFLAVALFYAALLSASPAGAQLSQAEQLVADGYKYKVGDEVEIDYDMALKYYKDALRVDPDMFQARFNAALIYYSQGKYEIAGHQFNKIAKAAGTENAALGAQARNMLGTCLQKTDNLSGAETQFRLAIKLAPSQVEPYYNLINLMVTQDHIEDAKKILNIAQTYAPSERYEIFKGKIKGRESREEWEPKGVKIAVLVLAVVLFLYWGYKRFTA